MPSSAKRKLDTYQLPARELVMQPKCFGMYKKAAEIAKIKPTIDNIKNEANYGESVFKECFLYQILLK